MSILSIPELTLPHRILPMTGNLGQLHSGSLSEDLTAHCSIVTECSLTGWHGRKITWKMCLYSIILPCEWSLPLLKHIIKYSSLKFSFEHTEFSITHWTLWDPREKLPSGLNTFSGATEVFGFFLSLKFINTHDCFPLFALAARKFVAILIPHL